MGVAKSPLAQVFAVQFILIDKPSPAASGPTPVRIGSGLGVGSCDCQGGLICAEGRYLLKAGEDLKAVYGKIVAATGDPDLDPDDPCTVEGTVDIGARTWAIKRASSSDIPCAQCSNNPLTPTANRLRVWGEYEDGSIESCDVTFGGVCANDTQCGGGLIIQSQRFKEVPTLAPKRWIVQAQGFTDKRSAFNGVWTLELTHGMHGVWDNAGGKKVPRVELRLDIDRPDEWRLTFAWKRAKAVYFQSNNNWLWSKENDLLFTDGDPVKKGVPFMVRVVPG
ncbi:MAG: hypothetical protein L0Y72_17240 [Gemmataceae bacterium]|nr:hypothetical protein [Gemmataceae bacterium]MCI0740798.1 hypothetical protein [Gemmataceae bacterium]